MNVADPADDTMTELDELRVACMAYRQAHGLSRRQLAELVHSSRNVIFEFELDLCRTEPSTVDAIRELVRP